MGSGCPFLSSLTLHLQFIQPDPANAVRQGRAAKVAAATATGEELCK